MHARFAPIAYLLGLILAIVAGAMLVPATFALSFDISGAAVFAVSSAITAFVAGALVLGSRGAEMTLNVRQMYLLTALAWVTASFFASLPLAFHGIGLDLTDAVFEATSGLTTTGSTVMSGLDTTVADILLWRALLQWLGGLGIIVMAMVALPVLRIGGMQLFRTESSDRSEKVVPLSADFTRYVVGIYVLLTVLCAIGYWLAGMTFFNAVLHALTTLSTGGYSPHDASLGQYTNPAIHWVAIIFMMAGALPFVLYIQLTQRKSFSHIRQSQVVLLMVIVAGAAATIAVWLVLEREYSPGGALTHALFNVISVVTTTGYASADYMTWGSLPITIIFALMFLGGCTGSTSGGIKMLRLQIIYLFARAQVARQTLPQRVISSKLGGQEVTTEVASSVLAFVGLYIASIVVVAIVLSAFGIDFFSAMTSAITAIGNVGPGLGPVVGPSGNFASFPDAAKWVMSGAMLLGRLELMTVLVVLTPFFWREW